MKKTGILFSASMIFFMTALSIFILTSGNKKDSTFQKEFKATLNELPQKTRDKILSMPDFFLQQLLRLLENDAQYLLFVDNATPIPDATNFVPLNLINLKYYSELACTQKTLKLTEEVIPHLLKMDQAAKADGVHLTLASAYRSYTYQKALHQYWANELGSTQSKRISAEAGMSQHQLGTTIDFYPISKKFATTDSGIWLKKNSDRFGFSLSYPEGAEELTGFDWEPWHFRYIGEEASEIQNFFFSGVQYNFLKWWHNHRVFFEEHLLKNKDSK